MGRTPEYASDYDRAAVSEGPASIFTVDAKRWIRLDVERTREIWIVLSPEERAQLHRQEPIHFVLTDEKTGLYLYMMVTHPWMAERQPRGTVEQVADMETGLERVAAAWAARRPNLQTSDASDVSEPGEALSG